jgi:hypothetical protein
MTKELTVYYVLVPSDKHAEMLILGGKLASKLNSWLATTIYTREGAVGLALVGVV